jgi:hypothetical protein
MAILFLSANLLCHDYRWVNGRSSAFQVNFPDHRSTFLVQHCHYVNFPPNRICMPGQPSPPNPNPPNSTTSTRKKIREQKNGVGSTGFRVDRKSENPVDRKNG